MPLQPGTTLGPYESLSPIGAGGMGEVYKARDTRLDRTVAIKVLPEHVASDPDLKQRFEREAKTISSLNHPHICTLHDIGSQDGIGFLVMEHLEGDTLAQRLTKGRCRSRRRRVREARDLRRARAARRGLCHPHAGEQEPGAEDRGDSVSSAGTAEPQALGALQEFPLSGEELDRAQTNRCQGRAPPR